MPRALARLRLPYILLPHNIEAAVSGQFTGLGREVERQREIAAIRGAEALWVISQYDRELVARYGAEAEVLPYFPPERDLRWLERIRKGRTQLRQDVFLVLGTVHNPPTRQGLQDLLSTLRRYEGEILGASVVVAGFGVERLRVPSSSRIQVFGGVSDEILTGLMMRAKCALVRQPPTSGFATRLTEFNLSSIPVYINDDYSQARGLEEYGIFCYRSEDDLIKLIGGAGARSVGRHFERPVDQENALRLWCDELGATW